MNECSPRFAQQNTGPGWPHAPGTGVRAGVRAERGRATTSRRSFPSSQVPRLHPGGPLEALPRPPQGPQAPLLLPPYPLPEASPSPPSWKRFCCLRRSCVLPVSYKSPGLAHANVLSNYWGLGGHPAHSRASPRERYCFSRQLHFKATFHVSCALEGKRAWPSRPGWWRAA